MRTQTILLALCVLPTISLADEPCPIQRLIGEPTYSDSFGGQMQIEAGRLIIRDGNATTACPGGGDPFGCIGGALYSYRMEDGRWVDPQFIFPPDVGLLDRFGNFDVEGDRMVAATPQRFQDPRLGGLHIYDFDHPSGRWVETERVPAPDADYVPTRGFGSDLVLHGRFVLVSRGETVFLYEETAEGWSVVQTIDRYDPTRPTDHFGSWLAMTNDWAIISAQFDDTLGYRHGALYVYRRDDQGLLDFHEKLLPPIDGGGIGGHMTLDGPTLAIEGWGSAPSGSIFVYELTDGGLQFHQDVTIDQGMFEQTVGIGIGLSLSGDTMVCGSHRGSWRPNERAGYVFKRGRDGMWRLATLLDPEPATPYRLDRTTAHFTATDGRYAILGSPNEFESFVAPTPIGAAYSFDLDCEICEPDLDLDGALTIFDFLTFLNLFDAGDPLADFDGDGGLTIFDFLAFQTAFDAGCE